LNALSDHVHVIDDTVRVDAVSALGAVGSVCGVSVDTAAS
jgi:hypothetical protein